MAYYAALASLVNSLDEMNRDPFQNYLPNNKQLTKPLRLKFIQLLASVAEYLCKGDGASDHLERRIGDLAYEAYDMILSPPFAIHDTIHSESEYEIHVVETISHELITAFLKAVSKLEDQHQDLQNVNQEVDSNLKDIKEIRGTEDLQLNHHHSADIGGSNQAPLARNPVVGFDEHIKAIREQLCQYTPKVQIIPITGMGGIGKTTLARKIFDDKFIVQHFEIRVWVTVSQDYHISKIVKSALNSINEVTHDLSEQELCVNIYQHFKGRRYLIILDDVWSIQVLDDVRRIFPDDGSSSRIMLTTRILDVANYGSDVNSHHEIKSLNMEQSWDLLRVNAFAQKDCPHELEDIGKLIANDCRGLPLAIVVVAGVLSRVNRTRDDWNKIAHSVRSIVAESGDEDFSRILSLSYNYLPHYLKPCFLYIGGFPEDYEISIQRLVKLWIAEGLLIKSADQFKSLEEVGDEYLEDLVKRNLVMITKKRLDGKSRFCSIHDLLRDLCIQRVRCENFFHVPDENGYIPRVGENVRRICFQSYQRVFNSRRLIIEEYASTSHVCTVLCFGNYFVDNWSLSGIQRLRVLDALQIKLHYFPDIILEMFHLRYLGFYLDPCWSTNIKVPTSISKLQNLETFIVNLGSKHKISLPSEIWKMQQLRHLMIDKMTISPVPSSYTRLVGEFHALQTLTTLDDFRFTDEVIQMIPEVTKLKVRYTDTRNGNWELYCLNNLASLHKLEELKIVFSVSLNLEPGGSGNPFPESFAFHCNLKKLSLHGCRLPWEDLTAVGCLPGLEVLKLHSNAVVGEEWEPIEGEFIQLQFLLMEGLDLQNWLADDTHFPKLRRLKISECGALLDIPSEIGEISTLELIDVHNSVYAAASAIHIQEEQVKQGIDTLQVHIYSRTTSDDL